MNTFRNYADYEIPLLQVLGDLPDGQGASREVRDHFGERFDDRIPDEHRVYLENVHESEVAQHRGMGAERADQPRAHGFPCLRHLAHHRRGPRIPGAGQRLSALTHGAITRSRSCSKFRSHYTLLIEGRSITLSAEDVLATARREIVRGLPPAAHDFQSWVVEVDGHQVGVKWLFGLATGHVTCRFQD